MLISLLMKYIQQIFLIFFNELPVWGQLGVCLSQKICLLARIKNLNMARVNRVAVRPWNRNISRERPDERQDQKCIRYVCIRIHRKLKFRVEWYALI